MTDSFYCHVVVYILVFTSLSNSSNSRQPSKLLSINNALTSSQQNTSSAPSISSPLLTGQHTHYFESFHYKFDIDDYDDIDFVALDDNGILSVSTHLNDTIYKLDLADIFDATPAWSNALNLDYDSLASWDAIYESESIASANNDNLSNHIRRRLGWWNIARHKGRYVADGVTRRFKDAQNNCRHLYGDLASIMSKEEEEKVKDLCAAWNLGNCWIGYKKPWGHWEDGRRPTYLHWKPGEPNNYGGNEGCAEISSSGQWNDIKCTLSRIGICERARIHVVGHYIGVMRSLSWADANKRCQELFSTDLATIENARENIMVRRACSAFDAKAQCWIGLHRPFRTWVDGEDMKVDNWADGEPNNAGGHEDCAAIEDSMRWNDANCGEGKFFVCNTITQDVRIRKRAEAKRRAQEKEAELEKKRKKMEDEIINNYMKQNENGMMQNMLTGQGLYSGPSGIGSPGSNMMAYGQGMPNVQQMYQMGSKQGQAAGMFNQMMTQQTGSMGGVGQQLGGALHPHQRAGYQYNHGGLDGTMSVGNLAPHQMSSVYGDLGPLGRSTGAGQYVPGKPLQVQLVGRRRRLQFIEQHEDEHQNDDVFGKKCKVLAGHELCVGHDYVNIKKYVQSVVKREEKDDSNVQPVVVSGNDEAERKVDYMGYLKWKYETVYSPPDTANYSGNDSNVHEQPQGYQDFVQYFLSKQFIFDAESEQNEQCFQYDKDLKLCMMMGDQDGMMKVVVNDMHSFEFANDEHWDEIESINNNERNDKITSKCKHMHCSEKQTKLCVQQTQNEDVGLSLYKAAVSYLAASGHRDYIPEF